MVVMRSVALQTAKSLTKSHVTIASTVGVHSRAYTRTTNLLKKDQLPPRPKVPEEETTKRYLKGSGPGGQKINKTSSAVQLIHLPTGIVVKSQATRSRTQNESIARRVLAEKVEVLEKGKESRVEKKRERQSMKKRSSEKKSRRKYRKLDQDKQKSDDAGEEVSIEEGFDDSEHTTMQDNEQGERPLVSGNQLVRE